MWKNGRTPMTVSSAVSACTSRTWHRFATTLRCVSITPFGRPVVPLEYGSATRASGPAAAGGPRPGPVGQLRVELGGQQAVEVVVAEDEDVARAGLARAVGERRRDDREARVG